MLATDALVSLPWLPMRIVQSVIPIPSALIVVAEVAYLVQLLRARSPTDAGGAAPAIADALH